MRPAAGWDHGPCRTWGPIRRDSPIDRDHVPTDGDGTIVPRRTRGHDVDGPREMGVERPGRIGTSRPWDRGAFGTVVARWRGPDSTRGQGRSDRKGDVQRGERGPAAGEG